MCWNKNGWIKPISEICSIFERIFSREIQASLPAGSVDRSTECTRIAMTTTTTIVLLLLSSKYVSLGAVIQSETARNGSEL
jgi:hypothetical protein